MADDLYVRLQKALDEAERRAHAANAHPWVHSRGWILSGEPLDPGMPRWQRPFTQVAILRKPRSDDEAAVVAADAAHIAGWDPSTVLRLIERDRKLLERHRHEYGQAIGAPPCIELQEAAEFWLTDTETTDGRR